MTRPLSVALVGLEPALSAFFHSYLGGYGHEFQVHLWDGADLHLQPDVLLANPHRPQLLTELRRVFPKSFILSRVPWDRPEYWDHPDMDERLDELASMESVVERLRKIRQLLARRQ